MTHTRYTGLHTRLMGTRHLARLAAGITAGWVLGGLLGCAGVPAALPAAVATAQAPAGGTKGHALTGGERRRVDTMRALATKPRFILLDEPFAGVDPLSVADLQEIIRDLKRKGLGVLISDHNVRETLQVCDFAYIMNNGQILTSGGADDIIHMDPRALVGHERFPASSIEGQE